MQTSGRPFLRGLSRLDLLQQDCCEERREWVLVNRFIIHFCRFLPTITIVHFFFFFLFNFIRHSAGCTVTAKLPISGSSPLSASVLHCWTAMVQTVVENSRLRPSGVKTSTCTKKPPPPLSDGDQAGRSARPRDAHFLCHLSHALAVHAAFLTRTNHCSQQTKKK